MDEDYKVGDEVWYIPRGYNILIRCKITELDDYHRKKEPQAYLFYDIEEPVGHSLADDEFFTADTAEEALDVFREYLQEWYKLEESEVDEERHRVDTLGEFRKRVIHFIVDTWWEERNGETYRFTAEEKEKMEQEWYERLPTKEQGVDWFNVTNIPDKD